MPITVEILGDGKKVGPAIEDVFAYFTSIDERFSTYKPMSEISQVNAGLPRQKWSREMALVMDLCDQTKQQTDGYFDIEHNDSLDPSGLVKGWSINNAAQLVARKGFDNFYIEAGGDIQTHGTNADGEPWTVGIRNPFDINQIIKVLCVIDCGVATSGTYIRGQHIYNPHDHQEIHKIKSLTVIGPDIYEADRFATAAFAMGEQGIAFIDALPGFEGYSVGADAIATYTKGFERYVA